MASNQANATAQIASVGVETTASLRLALDQRRAEYVREQAELKGTEEELEAFVEEEAEAESELMTLQSEIGALKQRLREKEALLTRKERGARVLREHAGVLHRVREQRRRRVVKAWRRLVAVDSSLEQRLRRRMEEAREAGLAYREYRRGSGKG
ncbi:MAG: hypothetical protein M1816_004872 [Peltula sp. TS41687]|nr:MAG: hypothetical protein M1816_004872 [Peltula sp. TS41687]